MRLLPVNTLLGPLRIKDIYEYYNFPLLLVCTNSIGNLLIGILIDSQDEVNIWLYLPISEQRYQELKESSIDLNSAYMNPEGGVIYRVSIEPGVQEHPVEMLTPNDLDIDALPPLNHFLLMDSESLPPSNHYCPRGNL